MTSTRPRNHASPQSPPYRLPAHLAGRSSPCSESAGGCSTRSKPRASTRTGPQGRYPLVHALLVAIAMLLPVASQAQEEEVVLVSNFANESAGSFLITSAEYLRVLQIGSSTYTLGEGENRIAQQFTTGANSGGYTLRSVELNLRQEGGEGSVVHVAIHRDSFGNPGTQLVVLDNPANPIEPTPGAAGNRTFSAASAFSLDARARYWVVLKDTKNTGTPGPERYSASFTFLPDETGAEGFRIQNGNNTWSSDVWTTAWDIGDTRSPKLRMEILGTVAAAGPVTPITPSDDATLTGLKVHDGSSNLTLTPTFVSSTLAYGASLGNALDEVTVTVTKNHARAAITFFDGDDEALVDEDALAGGFQVGSLAVGANTIKVKVTAEDGTTTGTYTVTVTREAAVPTDVTAPFVDFPSVNNPGTEVVLPFGEALNLEEGEVANTLVAAFTLSVEGAERDIDPLEWRTKLQVAGGALVLTPASVIYKGQSVVVSYDKVKAELLAIVDLANNKLESFTTGSGGVDAVANFSTVPSVGAPTNFTAGVGNAQVPLSWDAPASDSDITRHEYGFKTTGGYPGTWTQIPDSGVDGANEDGHTVTGLTNEVAHTFQLRAVKDGGFGTAAESGPVTPTPGICDRTQEVQDGILAQLADIAECEAVTVANLATVTELHLYDENITALKEGDFAGLPAVTYISLNGNQLGALPANLFSGLASLGVLNLGTNQLTSLPDGLFSGLPALKTLDLSDNDLESLPDGLFSGLPPLAALKLDNNPDTGDTLPLTVTVEKVGTDQARAKVLAGAPFAVDFTATVANGSLAGGATTLGVAVGSVDGTPVTVTRTAGIMAAVTVDIDLTTQPTLPAGSHSGYEFEKAPSGLPATILPAAGNNAPVFSATSTTRTVAENSAAGTNVGAVIPEATDADSDDTLTYSMEGTDAASFDFDASTRQITTITGVDYNFEATKNSYSVTVKADDGNGSTDTIEVTINIQDVNEKSAKPAKPTLAAVTGSSTTLTATWTKPDLDGGPEITGYDVQYREGTTGTWMDFTHSDTAVTTTITRLTADTSYQVRVRAENGETDSDWSDASDAVSTNAATPGTLPTLSVADAEAFEGDDVEFTVTLSEAATEEVTATWTATIGSDDTAFLADLGSGPMAMTGTVTIAVNATTGSFLVHTTDDHTDEEDETFTVTLSSPSSNAQLATDPTAQGTIKDNDAPLTNNAPEFSVELAAFTLLENSAADVVVGTVTATDADDDMLTYNLEGTDAGSFAIDSGKGEIKTKAGVTYDYETKFDYEMTAKADDGNGGTDTIDVAIALLDDDTKSAKPDKPTLAPVPGSSTSLTATWTKPDLNGGTEITGYDVQYRVGTTGTWELFEHISTAVTTTITGLTADTSYQARVRAANDEAFSDWSDASDAVSTNADASVVTLHLSNDEPLENAGWVAVTATVSPASPVPFTVTVSATPVAPATDDDFELSSGRDLVFTANATESTGLVRIRPVDDDDPEPHDVVTVSGAVSNAAIPDPDDVTLTIINDDADIPQDIAIDAPESVDEDAGTAAVTVTLTTRRNTAPVIDVNLFYRRLSETATPGNDYTLPSDLVTRFAIVPVSAFSPNAAGTAYVAQHAFMIGIVDDQEGETDETIVFQIYSQNNDPGSSKHTITIRDDDAAVPGRPTGLSAAAKSQTRIQLAWTAPADDGSFAITGYRIEASEDAGSSWNVVDRTRDARTDFRHGGLSAGDTRHYRVSAISDAGASAPSNVASATTVSAGPAATNANLPPPADVTAAPKLPHQIRFGWWTPILGGGIDSYQYRMRAVGVGDWSNWTRVNRASNAFHSLFRKNLDAGTTYEFQVRSVDKSDTYSAAVSALATATGPQTISIARPSGTVTEGEPLRFTLSRDQPNGRLMVILRISETGDMLPQEGRQSNGLWTKSVYFGDGKATIPVVLETVDDGDASEPDSRVTVEVMPYPLYPGNSDNNKLYEVHGSRGSATKTVTARTESTRSAALSVADAEATEGEDATLDFLVRLDGNPGSDVTVDYETRDGTATAGSDYTETSGTLTFAPGEDEKTVPVPIADDDVEDDGETFTLVLSNASGGGSRTNDNEAVGTIRNSETTTPQADLTASFEGVPEAHDGEGGFRFRVAFSEDIGISFRSLREDAFTVTGGRVTGGKRVDGRRDLFEMTVEPDAGGDVTITLPAGRECGVSGAICTKGENRRQLTNSPSATVAGPMGISVADARVEEGAGETIDFAVTLDRAASRTVTVDYATSDGTATAGTDYTATSGTLTFTAGDRSKTVSVAVLDDSHDEGEETLTLRLSNPSSGRLTDGEAMGTIKNSDPLQRAWLSRFGRMAALQVVDHVEARLAARRKPGFRGRFAGRELRRGMERDLAENLLRRLGRTAAPGPIGGMAAPIGGMAAPIGGGSNPLAAGSGPDGGLDWGRLLRMGLGGGDVMTASDFALDRETGLGGIVSVWSRGSMLRFTGREGALSLGGDVRTTMFGADYAQGPLVAGLMLSHSRGLGEYAGVDAGLLRSSVTGLYPWLGYRATERISVWAVTGYGTGGLLLTPEGVASLRSGLSMAMVAAGARGALAGVAGGGGTGFGLSFKADALWVGTSIAGVDGPDGRLAAASSSVTRVRTALEGSGGFTFGGGLSLKPSVEVGLRHDGGDADAGSGLDMGGGLVVADASTGLVVDVRARTLLAHEAEGFSERGVSVQFSWNPSPSTPLGFTARVAPSWGVQATGGAEALWGRETMEGVGARGGPAPGNRFDAEMGYGLPLGGRFVGTPRVGVRTSAAGRDYRLGYSLGVLGGGVLNLSLGVDAHRREGPHTNGADHGVAGRVGVRW